MPRLGHAEPLRPARCGTLTVGGLRELGSARLQGWERSMPEANLTGEVFTADASAGFDEGIVRGDVGSDARLSFATRFELCHGLSVEASAEAAVQALAELDLLWLITGRAEGQASAAAGVELDAQV